MNTRKSRIAIALVAVLAVVGMACASTSPARTALDTLQVAKATADSAMRVCAAAYTAGQLTETQKAQAIAAYDTFAAAEIAGAQVLQGSTAQADVDAVVTSVSKTLADLLNLLRAFGVKV